MSLTPKQEKFCQCIVKGMSQADAYRNSYNVKANTKPETCQNKGYALMQRVALRARVETMRKPVIDKIQYGLKEALTQAEEAFQVSKTKENGGAMAAAVTLKAKLRGLLIERKEIRTGPLDTLEHDDLKQLNDAIQQISGTSAESITGGISSARH